MRHSRSGKPLSPLALDLDWFKRINDAYGHPAGDAVLAQTAEVIRRAVRLSDVPVRIGGEEFTVLLPETDRSAALVVAEKVRRAVEEANWPQQPVTISIGVGCATPQMASDPHSMMAKADRALYAAKEAGRNHVRAFVGRHPACRGSPRDHGDSETTASLYKLVVDHTFRLFDDVPNQSSKANAMRFSKVLIAVGVLCSAMASNAAVTGALGGGASGSFLSLSSAGLNGGTVATLSGGTVYNADQPFADIPAGGVFGGNFLAAGPTSGAPATLTFAGTGVDFVSFLWGSPDTYNVLTVISGGLAQTFSAMSLGFAVTDGNQSFSQYVNFTGLAGAKITSLSFDNVPATNAFETANYSITPVPEPETYALLLAGLGAVGYMARRRKS